MPDARWDQGRLNVGMSVISALDEPTRDLLVQYITTTKWLTYNPCSLAERSLVDKWEAFRQSFENGTFNPCGIQ